MVRTFTDRHGLKYLLSELVGRRYFQSTSRPATGAQPDLSDAS